MALATPIIVNRLDLKIFIFPLKEECFLLFPVYDDRESAGIRMSVVISQTTFS